MALFIIASLLALCACVLALAVAARHGEAIITFISRVFRRRSPFDSTDISAQRKKKVSNQTLPVSRAEVALAAGNLRELQEIYSGFYATGDWQATLESLALTLPRVVERRAIESRRSAVDIVNDILKVIAEPLLADLKDPHELRLEQRKVEFRSGWVAAYPFLDLADETNGGFYETLVFNLKNGAQYVYFQPDRKYFELLKERLLSNPELKAVCLDEENRNCQVWCVEPVPAVFKVINFALWNPGSSSMEGFVNTGDPIDLEFNNGIWKPKARVVMKPITDKSRLKLFYETVTKPAYDSFFTKKGFYPTSPCAAESAFN